MRFQLAPHGARQWRNALIRLSLSMLVILLVPLGFWSWCAWMPGASFRGPLPVLDPETVALRERLRGHVEKLAADIEERNIIHPQALAAAERYVRSQLAAGGRTVTEQRYQAHDLAVANLELELVGTTRKDEIVVVGAHYDSVEGTPGADDNASGTAALLELGRMLASRPHARTLRLVAFVNEEPPYFKTDLMGSLQYAKQARLRNERIVAMLSLETLGYYDTHPKTQKYPAPLGLLYPDTADFVAFVGELKSRALVRRALGIFRHAEPFPSEGLSGPAWVSGVDFSDHWSFAQQGYPAIMVSDTAFFRNAHYHEVSDTPSKLDYDRLARVTRGLARVIHALADASE